MRESVGKRHLLGMLTPSSNTVLEPLTAAMLHGLEDTTAHFGRFKVTEISLGGDALDQFTEEPMLQAAELLSHAKVDVICWNGTSSGWLGFDKDRQLCQSIEERTGIKACSSVLALNEIFECKAVERFALVTPYLDEIQERIVDNYQSAGFRCVAERHLRDRGNYSFSEVSEETIATLCREVAHAKPQAIAVFCTNMRGAPVVEELEAELGIPVYDTVATAVWKSLRTAGVDTNRVQGWGSLFSDLP